MDAWSLCYIRLMLLSQWGDSNFLLHHSWICTWQSSCQVWKYLQQVGGNILFVWGKVLCWLGIWPRDKGIPLQVMSGSFGLERSHAWVEEARSDLCKKRQATLARQTAEWGMRMFQTSFPRVKDRFIYEERGERRICLKMLVLLYNMRVRMVGINQIRNTYMKHLTRNAIEDALFWWGNGFCRGY